MKEFGLEARNFWMTSSLAIRRVFSANILPKFFLFHTRASLVKLEIALGRFNGILSRASLSTIGNSL